MFAGGISFEEFFQVMVQDEADMERLEGEEGLAEHIFAMIDQQGGGADDDGERGGEGGRAKSARDLITQYKPPHHPSLLARLHTSLLPSRPIISPQKPPVLPRQRVRLPDSHLANYATSPHLAPGETVGAPSPLSSRPPPPHPPAYLHLRSDDQVSLDELRLAFSGVPKKDPESVKHFMYLFKLNPEGQINKSDFLRVVRQLKVLVHDTD